MSENKQMMLSDMATEVRAEIMEKVSVHNDLAMLSPGDRLEYYVGMCHSLKLNPLTRPFQFLQLDGKLTMYATKDATEQLRVAYGVSIVDIQTIIKNDLIQVKCTVELANGRRDTDYGIVPAVKADGTWETSGNGRRFFKKTGTYSALDPVELSNAMMKAVTKAKRRATLSSCGLGIIDDSEIHSIAGAQRVNMDIETGEITPEPGDVVDSSFTEVEPEPAKTLADNTHALMDLENVFNFASVITGKEAKAIEAGILASYNKTSGTSFNTISEIEEKENTLAVIHNKVMNGIKATVGDEVYNWFSDLVKEYRDNEPGNEFDVSKMIAGSELDESQESMLIDNFQTFFELAEIVGL